MFTIIVFFINEFIFYHNFCFEIGNLYKDNALCDFVIVVVVLFYFEIYLKLHVG